MLFRYEAVSGNVRVFVVGMNIVPLCVVHWLVVFCDASCFIHRAFILAWYFFFCAPITCSPVDGRVGGSRPVCMSSSVFEVVSLLLGGVGVTPGELMRSPQGVPPVG
jgi:hypothetical protein